MLFCLLPAAGTTLSVRGRCPPSPDSARAVLQNLTLLHEARVCRRVANSTLGAGNRARQKSGARDLHGKWLSDPEFEFSRLGSIETRDDPGEWMHADTSGGRGGIPEAFYPSLEKGQVSVGKKLLPSFRISLFRLFDEVLRKTRFSLLVASGFVSFVYLAGETSARTENNRPATMSSGFAHVGPEYSGSRAQSM